MAIKRNSYIVPLYVCMCVCVCIPFVFLFVLPLPMCTRIAHQLSVKGLIKCSGIKKNSYNEHELADQYYIIPVG